MIHIATLNDFTALTLKETEEPWMKRDSMWGTRGPTPLSNAQYPRKHTKWKQGQREQPIAYHAVAMQASKGKHSTIMHFDTNAGNIGLDNRASACISHESTDFVGELRESNRVIKSFSGGRTKSPMVGTLKWRWLDDDGKEHTSIIPLSLIHI